jgi:hypothetical protein
VCSLRIDRRSKDPAARIKPALAGHKYVTHYRGDPGGTLPNSAPPAAQSACGFDFDLSTVKSHGFLFGAEWQATQNTILAAYYGETFFQNNFFQDITSPLVVKPFIGFGGPNSPNSANKVIQEWTADIKHTYWGDPRLGAIQSLFQYSYIQREFWFVALGAPPETHTHQILTEFRYLFPG